MRKHKQFGRQLYWTIEYENLRMKNSKLMKDAEIDRYLKNYLIKTLKVKALESFEIKLPKGIANKILREKMKKHKFKWTVEIEVADVWVADGYEVNAENLKDAILGYGLRPRPGEIRVKIIKKPSKKRLKKIQKMLDGWRGA